MGPENLILGPIVAPDHKLALALIDRLSYKHEGKLRIDTPIQNHLFINCLQERGFEKVSQPPVMIFNCDTLPKRNGQLYGIAAQVFG